MSVARFLRNRAIGSARRALAPLRELREARRPAVVPLTEVQRRLELLLGAMFGRRMRVVAEGAGEAGPSDVVLPPALAGADDARERYRVLAVQQAMRIERDARTAAPDDTLARDLYQIIEGAASDAALVARAPGLRAAIARARRAALARRPASHALVGHQRATEGLLRAVLERDADEEVAHLPRTSSAGESAAAAHAMADAIRRGQPTRTAYRPIASVGLWDGVQSAPHRAALPPAMRPDISVLKLYRVATPDGRDGKAPMDDGESEMDAEGGAGGREPAAGGGGATRDTMREHDARRAPGGIRYPEWIARHARLEPAHATVRVSTVPEGGDAWARHELDAHAPLVRQIRDRFAMLRAHRVRLRAQRAGDDLDLDACVQALTDARLGWSPTDRLYSDARATRQPLALAILVDVSGSTRTELPDHRRVIDVERLSLLLAREGIDALGDRYAILAFSGLGRHEVRVATVKSFDDGDGRAVLRRIASLEPGDNTRLGAAVRHATALLAAQPARHRVLLLISDGRPNDVDRYQGIDGVEDARQAILSARTRGVHPFCLTVDAEESEYLPHLFGEGGYQILRDPAHLPGALLRLVVRLIRG